MLGDVFELSYFILASDLMYTSCFLLLFLHYAQTSSRGHSSLLKPSQAGGCVTASFCLKPFLKRF